LELLEPKLAQLLDDQGGLNIKPLVTESKEQRSFLLRLWLQKQGATLPSELQLDVLWRQVALAQQDANPRLSLPDGQIRRFKGRLFYIAKSNDVSDWVNTWSTSERQLLPEGLGTLTIQNIEVLDSNSRMTLSRQSLPPSVEVVFDPQGLNAHPYGRIGSRKLKKLFQEYGVPSWLRQRTPILLAQGKVIAVAGLFVERDFYGQDCELIWDK
jgi:tRNA(Ile)-lysidine synthase